MINVICDRALLGAYTLDRHRVTSGLVRHAATEVFGRRFAPQWLPWAVTAGIAAVLDPRHGCAVAVPALEQRTHAADAPLTQVVRPGRGRRHDPDQRHAGTCGGRAPAAPHLAQLLTQYSAETDTDTAFSRLFALWGAKYQPGGTDPCTQASQQGLECVAERGSFGQLHLYNHPAILLLTDAGRRPAHQVVLTALGDDQASLELGGTHTVPIGELTRYWLGDFVMLWHPANSPVKALSAGMRGADVRWLRQSLQRLHGAAARCARQRPVRCPAGRAGARLPARAPALGRWHRRRADADRAGERGGRRRRAPPVRH